MLAEAIAEARGLYLERQHRRWCCVHAFHALLGRGMTTDATGRHVPVVDRDALIAFQHAEQAARQRGRAAARDRRAARRLFPGAAPVDHPLLQPMGLDGGMDPGLVARFLRTSRPDLPRLVPVPVVPGAPSLSRRDEEGRGPGRDAFLAALGPRATGAIISDSYADPPHAYAIRRLQAPGDAPGGAAWALLDSHRPHGMLLGHEVPWEDLAGDLWTWEEALPAVTARPPGGGTADRPVDLVSDSD